MLLLVNTVINLILVGLIWTIQLVHYPSFKFVDDSCFAEFEAFHIKRISILVMPLMLAELFISLISLKLETPWSYYSLLIVGLIWISTFFLSVPLHKKLKSRKNIETISKLVQTNWPRTILWTLKSIYLLSILWKSYET